MRKNVVVLSLTVLHRDPRVLRQLNFLKDYQVTAVGLTDPHVDGVGFIEIPEKKPNTGKTKLIEAMLVLLGRFEYLFWKQENIRGLKKRLDGYKRKVDFVIANDATILPLAAYYAKEWAAELIVDLHEYAPREMEENLKWRLRYKRYYSYILRKYLPQASAVMTVCDGIAKVLKARFDVDATIVTNAPAYEELEPSPINPSRIDLIHHGGAMQARKLESMIGMMKFLDERFHLNLMLIESDPGYLSYLKNICRDEPRIHFLSPVSTTEIAAFINKFDIGLFLLEPVNFNYQVALPNKFFEFIQARLAITIGPSPEMAKLVAQYNLGLIGNDFRPESLAIMLNKMSVEELMAYKINSGKAALYESANKNKSVFLQLLES